TRKNGIPRITGPLTGLANLETDGVKALTMSVAGGSVDKESSTIFPVGGRSLYGKGQTPGTLADGKPTDDEIKFRFDGAFQGGSDRRDPRPAGVRATGDPQPWERGRRPCAGNGGPGGRCLRASQAGNQSGIRDLHGPGPDSRHGAAAGPARCLL